MNIKPIDIFSVYVNCKSVCDKVKYTDLDKRVYKGRWEKSAKFITQKCTEIWNDIQNSFYSLDDVKVYILHGFLFNQKFGWKEINNNDIKETISKYDKAQFIIDKQTILEISKKILEIKDINDYFCVNEDGESFIYDLIINRYVNPIFYIRMIKYLDDKDYESENTEHRRFRFIQKVIASELGISFK